MPSTRPYPPGTVECAAGDHVLRRDATGQWEVLRIEQLALITRLVPLHLGHGVEFMPETDVVDSLVPEMFVLATTHHDRFADAAAAGRAAADGRLRPDTAHVAVRLGTLTTTDVVLVPRATGPG